MMRNARNSVAQVRTHLLGSHDPRIRGHASIAVNVVQHDLRAASVAVVCNEGALCREFEGVCVCVAGKGRLPLQIEPAVREGGQGDKGRKSRVAVLVERLAQLEQHVQHFPCHALAGGGSIIVIRIIKIIIAL
jgi:hypothetical protein